jgi:hypothetical protein
MVKESPKFFTQKDLQSRYLPEATWEELVDEKKIIAPSLLKLVLEEAKDFLINEPGPNKWRREILAPLWFNHWIDELERYAPRLDGDRSEDWWESDKLARIEDLNKRLAEKQIEDQAGVLFVAGAEGHFGHVAAAGYMREQMVYPIWAFEQDGYLERYKVSERRSVFTSGSEVVDVAFFSGRANDCFSEKEIN